MWQVVAAQAAKAAAEAMGGPNTSGGPVSPFVDGSGWTVATGGSKASATRSDSAAGALTGAMANDPTVLMFIAGSVVVLLIAFIKRKK